MGLQALLLLIPALGTLVNLVIGAINSDDKKDDNKEHDISFGGYEPPKPRNIVETIVEERDTSYVVERDDGSFIWTVEVFPYKDVKLELIIGLKDKPIPVLNAVSDNTTVELNNHSSDDILKFHVMDEKGNIYPMVLYGDVARKTYSQIKKDWIYRHYQTGVDYIVDMDDIQVEFNPSSVSNGVLIMSLNRCDDTFEISTTVSGTKVYTKVDEMQLNNRISPIRAITNDATKICHHFDVISSDCFLKCIDFSFKKGYIKFSIETNNKQQQEYGTNWF